MMDIKKHSCRSKLLKSIGIALFIFPIINNPFTTAYAAEISQAGLSVNFLRETSTGMLIGLTPALTDCSGNVQGANAYMSRSVSQYFDNLIKLKTAKMLGVSVTVYYADNGDCAISDGLLHLSNIEIQ